MRLEVLKIERYGWFTLLGEDGKERKVNLHFYELPRELKVGDTIEMNENLFNPNFDGYCGSYAFGPLSGEFGREIESFLDVDCIMVTLDGKEIFLKRFYG